MFASLSSLLKTVNYKRFRKYISEYVTTDDIQENRKWAEALVGETIESADAGYSYVRLTLSNDTVLNIDRQSSRGRK